MRTLFKLLGGTLLALLLLAAVLLTLAVETTPRVSPRDDVSPADVERAVGLLRQHDPRNAAPGELQHLPLRERDVDLLAQHAARRWLSSDARARLAPGLLVVDTSLAAPWGRWLNIELGLGQSHALPRVAHLRVGKLPLPTALVWPLARRYATHKGLRREAWSALELVEAVDIGGERLTLSYRLQPHSIDRLRAAVAAPLDPARLRAYAERLAVLTRAVDRSEVSLTVLLPPLFALAAQRSAQPGSDAVAENRAALLTLALFARQRPLGELLPAAYTWPVPRPLVVTLVQRPDTALHFLVSAVIAAEAGSPLADAVGLWKELADAGRGGSGFSFNDLAANRAGTRFGERAARDPARLQARLASGVGVSEADVMPPAADLPEALSEADFLARYGGVGGDGYGRLRAEIEARVDALPLLR